MLRALRHLAVFLTLAGAALAASACGGSASGSGDAAQVVRETFRNSEKVRSGRLHVAVDVKLEGLKNFDKPIRVTFAGPFDRPSAKAVPRFDFDVSLRLGPLPFTAGATSTGGRVFFSLQGDAYELPAATAKTFRDAFSSVQNLAQPALGAKGDVPWLTDLAIEGDEEVAGAPTTHVSAKVDVGKLLDLLGSNGSGVKLTPKQKADVAKAVQDPRLDLYSGTEDRVLRRLKAHFGIELPESLRSQARGLKRFVVDVDYAIAEVNKPQKIVAPSSTKPIGGLATRLQGILQVLSTVFGGALTGGGASGAGGTTGSGSGGSDAEQYGPCLKEAGNDIAKAQKCAELLK